MRLKTTGRSSRVRAMLFKNADRAGYVQLKLPIAQVKAAILSYAEFTAYNGSVIKILTKWGERCRRSPEELRQTRPSQDLIETIAEDLLATFGAARLLDAYDVYQHLMDYWAATMVT